MRAPLCAAGKDDDFLKRDPAVDQIKEAAVQSLMNQACHLAGFCPACVRSVACTECRLQTSVTIHDFSRARRSFAARQSMPACSENFSSVQARSGRVAMRPHSRAPTIRRAWTPPTLMRCVLTCDIQRKQEDCTPCRNLPTSAHADTCCDCEHQLCRCQGSSCLQVQCSCCGRPCKNVTLANSCAGR